ncbi:MAG: type IV pili methyl-accepting chemotaxis transducer N-terminal domain-containing protein, partial [Cyanobacteria bacterium J06555_12]
MLVTLQFIGLRFAASQQQLSAAEINLSGRQRMLSQRIAWMMSELNNEVGYDTATSIRRRLAACTDLMARSHNALQRRSLEEIQSALASGSFCLGDPQTKQLTQIDDLTEVTEPMLLAAFLQSAWDVANDKEQPAETELSFSVGPVSALLQRLNAETLSAQKTSTSHLSTILALNWALILALVLGELFLIFRPMARTVDSTLRKLSDANDELSNSEKRLKDFATTGAHQFWETDQLHRFTWIETSDPVTDTRPQEINIGREPWRIHRVDTSDGDWASLRDAMLAHEPFMSFEYS